MDLQIALLLGQDGIANGAIYALLALALVLVGLVTQERQATTLLCRANYDVMHSLIEFLVAECCADSACPTQPVRARTG